MLYNTHNIIVTITALTTAMTEIGVITPGGTSLVAALGTSDFLSNISFSMTRYDMPSFYNDAARSILQVVQLIFFIILITHDIVCLKNLQYCIYFTYYIVLLDTIYSM
jgi:hypothetical protein